MTPKVSILKLDGKEKIENPMEKRKDNYAFNCFSKKTINCSKI